MERKYLSRSHWNRVEQRKCILINTIHERFNGYACAIFVEKVRDKLVCRLGEREFCIVDDGYSWIQILPIAENWTITTMFDEKNNIIQWYIDITKLNSVDDSGQPFYDDLYLDIVIFPSGETVLFDEDELREALDSKIITQADYDMAYETANKILNGMAKDITNLTKTSYDDLSFFKEQI